ncbi:MAG: metal-dependent hydrolase [Bacteroidetes bacterium]|nr:metal-dependent hydrolase [Bacteroidota bacterium]
MKLTYYGQSCYMVEVSGMKLLFDPFIRNNPLSKKIDINSIDADYLFLSHGHGDHSADAIEIAKRTNALCISPFEVANWFGANGIEKVHPINQGGPVHFDFGSVRGVNAIHSSSFSDGSYAGNPIGFLFNTQEGDFYYSGDTALTMDMQLIPRWAKPKFAVLPIGGNFTMNVEDAIIASDFIQCNTVVGVHYNTFDLIKINKEEAIASFKNAGKILLLPAVGETIEV